MVTYVFVDSGNNVSFCAEILMHQLGAKRKRVKLSTDTMGAPFVMHTYEVSDFDILDFHEEHCLQLTAYLVDQEQNANQQNAIFPPVKILTSGIT